MSENENGELRQRVERLENIILNQLAGDDEEGDAPDDSGAHENPFGFSFGRSKKPAGGEKKYYIAFTDADDNTRDFNVNARNKTEAKAKAKIYLLEDGENLKGAQWHIELDD
jgi:hypothetical protein